MTYKKALRKNDIDYGSWIHRRLMAGRAAGIRQFCEKNYPREGRMDRSLGSEVGDGGGLCLPARDVY